MRRISVSSAELEEVFCRVLGELARARAERRRQRILHAVTIGATALGLAVPLVLLVMR